MKATGKHLFLITAALLSATTLGAQYYNNGAPPASQKWGQIRTDSLRVIFPLGFEDNARRTLHYMEAARPYVGYGFSYGPLRTPVVINTENFYSNGLGILAPKRIEIGGLPAIDTYANPWLKQLATHEYRHMVQYANINRSTVKVLSYVFGQQLSLLATGLLPFWFLEGDAVMAETQFTPFGRGVQPSHTLHYRAAGRELLSRRNPDKWFCGSYRDYVPSHYELGFQLVAHSERKYGKYIWDDVARYGSRYPFLLFTTQLALRKYYDTSTRKLFHDTFGYLNEYWDALPARPDSAEAVSRPGRTYSVSEHPIFIGAHTLLALRTDHDRPSRFVVIDLRNGTERTVCHTGNVSTRPVWMNGVVYWTEYRQTLWEQKTNSEIWFMTVGEWTPRRLRGETAALYPTPSPDGLAYVKYHYEGFYSIECGGLSYTFPANTSIHGLAWDDTTEAFYYIALDDGGMRIGGLLFDGDTARPFDVTRASYTTVSDLRAAGGYLYFGSIYSGYDEAHMLDLATGTESRITTSRYGSFSPAPSAGGDSVAVTVYGRGGYATAVQTLASVAGVYPASIPHNVVNPPIVSWQLPPIETVPFTDGDLEESRREKPMKRYRKATHLFNFHSWAPLNFDGEEFINNFDFNNMNLVGVSVVSQNLLSTATASAGYGYGIKSGNSLARMRFNYSGLAPKFEVNAWWSDSGRPVTFTVPVQPLPTDPGRNYFRIDGRVYLPLNFSSGRMYRFLTPLLQYQYRNSLFFDPFEQVYRDDEHIIAGALTYSSYVRPARLDLIPRWGYALRVRLLTEPVSNIIMPTAGLYGRVYTPGIVRTHGISLEGSYQWASGKGYIPYSVLDILPRGVSNMNPLKYAAVSAKYYFPVAYPDWGLSGVFFLKRIYMNIGADYAVFQRITAVRADGSRTYKRGSAYSYGGTAALDVGFLRLPSQGTVTITLGLYKPSTSRNLFVTGGFSVPL